MNNIVMSFVIFLAAAFCEILGGYLVWLWLREKRGLFLGAIGGCILILYGVLLTLQLENFGRVYSAYGGIFIVSSMIWGASVEKRIPDRYDVIGVLIVLVGAIVIFYAPR